eukprot:scaffold300_cov258-Pinguiococcus_pyrenoidosus.AAC.27
MPRYDAPAQSLLRANGAMQPRSLLLTASLALGLLRPALPFHLLTGRTRLKLCAHACGDGQQGFARRHLLQSAGAFVALLPQVGVAFASLMSLLWEED